MCSVSFVFFFYKQKTAYEVRISDWSSDVCSSDLMGNSLILKPSEKSPLSAIRIAELALEAGIPPGVFNVLPGFGKGAGEPLALHMDVDGIVFTGSTAVGKHLLQCAGRSNMKRAFMECGGKSPNLIFADAPDLAEAARAARSEEHTSELQSLMRISYAVFCLKKNKKHN